MAADSQDGNELHLEKFRLNFSSCCEILWPNFIFRILWP